MTAALGFPAASAWFASWAVPVDLPEFEAAGYLRATVADWAWLRMSCSAASVAQAAKAAGKGADLDALRAVDPDLVERESWLLGSALRQVAEELPQDGRALVIGHSPANEAAVLGLAGQLVPPLGKGEGILLTEDRGTYQAEPLD